MGGGGGGGVLRGRRGVVSHMIVFRSNSAIIHSRYLNNNEGKL